MLRAWGRGLLKSNCIVPNSASEVNNADCFLLGHSSFLSFHFIADS
jgi:hypothetical protein